MIGINPTKIRPVALMALTCILAVPLPQAIAQEGSPVLYKVQSGDTLSGLVSRYLQGTDALRQLVEFNAISNPNAVPVGYSLKIPRQLLKHVPSSATVSRLNCTGITRQQGETSLALKLGDEVQEGHVVRIPAGCQLALTLEDDSTLRMMSGSVIRFKALRRNALEVSPEVRVELLDGRIEANVPRKRQDNDAPVEIRTTTSVAGVRGTEFRVAFDPAAQGSQVEVLSGVVAAQGSADAKEQLAKAGQGVAIAPDGKALPVEDLLAAPQYADSQAGAGTQWVLRFTAPDLAKQLLVRQSEDVSFAFLSASDALTQPQLAVRDVGPNAFYQQWSSVSSSGIVGYGQNYALCKPYKREDLWRCNVTFNLGGLTNPHLRLLKLDASGQETPILDKALPIEQNDQLVLRGLPVGQYKWHIESDLAPNRRTSQQGDFLLVAITPKS